jgi:DNA gyrase subunit A
MSPNQRIIPINIEDEMKSAYIDYSMSVIVSRALPDVRDGLKPVHRRVLYGMHELGVAYNKAHKKSARIVGEVLGKYHPHGDSSVYDTMVRMAQDWSLRYPLVDGQGNFGSMDGDSPAAMRYTEARLHRISDEMLADINKETVDFALNFDDSLEEPTVLPARLPNLLVNGASGIAVGMATNMLPHNLSEVIDGIVATIEQPEITIADLMQFIKAPDFPTGGIIYGYQGVRDAMETGRGRIVVRGKAEIQNLDSGRERIVVTEIPYQVNKASLVARMAELVNEKKVEGVSDIRDESDRNGLRIVVDVKRDAIASVILSQFYKYTPLQTSFGVNNVALVHGRPMILNLKDMIEEFIAFRIEVIVRRTRYDLRKAKSRAHILIGLLIALDYLDAVISLIRRSSTPDEAREGLMQGAFVDDLDKFWEKFRLLIDETTSEDEALAEGNVLTEVQAKAILDMRLQKLTGLERDKIKEEYEEVKALIDRLLAILGSEELQKQIVKDELQDIKERYGDERRTDISYADGEISIEDLIKDEEVVITISHLGYIKRTPVSEYRLQSRGGRGARGTKNRDEDFVEHLFIASTHNYLLLFTEQGKCYWLRVYEVPEASKTSGGRVIQNILSIPKDDMVKAYIIIKDLTDADFVENHFIVFCTRQGLIKKTAVEAFSRPRAGGIIAININDGDQLLEARLTNGDSEIFLASRYGYAIRFDESKVRAMGRSAAGVRGISLGGEDDAVVGMVCIDPTDDSQTIMVISEKGNGKRTPFDEYRLTNRGGKGVKTMMLTKKTGAVIAIKAVREEDDLMIINRSGIVIRIPVGDIRVMGRSTQGVRVIRLDEDDKIADVTVVPETSEEGEEENGNIEENGSNVEENGNEE